VVDTSAFGAASLIEDIVRGAGPMLGAVALSPDAQSLYATTPNGVAVIDAATLEGRERYLVGTDVSSVATSEDGDRLYAAARGAIRVLEATTGEHVGELIEAEQPYGVVATSPRHKSLQLSEGAAGVTGSGLQRTGADGRPQPRKATELGGGWAGVDRAVDGSGATLRRCGTPRRRTVRPDWRSAVASADV